MRRQWSARVIYFSHGAGIPNADDDDALAAREIVVEPRAIVRVGADAGRLVGVEVDDGRCIGLDKIFLAPALVPLDGVLRSLGAQRCDNGFGSFVATDAMGKTSIEGVWAAGNVSNPMANVPMAMGAGSFAGAAVNGDLINEEIADAVHAFRKLRR